MGAWGYLPFENDDALDWLEDLEAGGADVVRKALAKAADRYVQAPEGAIALAAAEVAAASQGNPLGDLPENVTDWVTAHGFEITADRPASNTMTFAGHGWSGSFTGDDRASAVLLRPR